MSTMTRRWFGILALFGALFGASPAWATAATDFTLRDVDGQSVSLSALRGKVVLISFWATWCGPCKEEMPHLQRMYEQHKEEGLVVLSISIDDARSASQVKPFIKRSGYTFPVLLDRESTVIGTYNPAKTVPFTMIIGRDFEVAEVHQGYAPGDEDGLARIVEQLLAQPAPVTPAP